MLKHSCLDVRSGPRRSSAGRSQLQRGPEPLQLCDILISVRTVRSAIPRLRYFAYGSNMLLARLRERVSSAEALGPGVLPGWELRFHKRGVDGSAKCGIVQASRSGASVHGVVVEMDAAEVPNLDRAESLGQGYLRRDFEIQIAGESVQAFSYVAQAGWITADLEPYAWYRDVVVAGARESGLPAATIEALLAVPVVTDPDPDRQRRYDRLLMSR